MSEDVELATPEANSSEGSSTDLVVAIRAVLDDIERRKKAERKPKMGHALRVAKALDINWPAGTNLAMKEMKVLVEMAGIKHTSLGTTMTFMVAEGYAERIRLGLYLRTSKPIA